MEEFKNLILEQNSLKEEIQKQALNYRKDSAERKSGEGYYRKRLENLDRLWKVFQRNNNRINGSEQKNEADAYFKENFYESVGDKVKKFKNILESDLSNRIEEAQEEKVALKRSEEEVERFIQKLWGLIEVYSNRDYFRKVQAKVESVYGLTKVEEADAVLEELIRILEDKSQEQQVSNLIDELNNVKKHNKTLTQRIQTFLEEGHTVEIENSQLRNSLGKQEEAIFEELRQERIALTEAHCQLRNLTGKLRVSESEKQRLLDVSPFRVPARRQLDLPAKPGSTEVVRKVILPEKVVIKPIKMASLVVADSVNKLVPMFSGANTIELQSDLQKFVRGCVLVDEGMPDVDQKVLIDCVKQRLYGDAYQLVSLLEVNRLSDLLTVIKGAYTKIRVLEDVQQEIRSAVQQEVEDIGQFARRLRGLQMSAKAIVRSRYAGNGDGALLAELDTSVKSSFRLGLRDPTLRLHVMRAEGTKTLEELEAEAISAEVEWKRCTLGMPKIGMGAVHAVNPTGWSEGLASSTNNSAGKAMPQHGESELVELLKRTLGALSSSVPEINANFSRQIQQPNEQGNFMGILKERLGVRSDLGAMPASTDRRFTSSVDTNGDVRMQASMQPGMNRQKRPPVMKCSFCNKTGHVWETCITRKNTPYCIKCGEYGHNIRQDCGKPEDGYSGYGGRNERNESGRGRNDRDEGRKQSELNTERTVQIRNPFRADKADESRRNTNSGNRVRFSGEDAQERREVVCFRCNRPGHMRRDCRAKIWGNNNQGN